MKDTQGVKGIEGRSSPDHKSSQMGTWSELSDVKGVDVGDIDTWDISQGSSDDDVGVSAEPTQVRVRHWRPQHRARSCLGRRLQDGRVAREPSPCHEEVKPQAARAAACSANDGAYSTPVTRWHQWGNHKGTFCANQPCFSLMSGKSFRSV